MSAPFIFLPGWCLGRGPLNATVESKKGVIFDLPGHGTTLLIHDFRAVTAQLPPPPRSPPAWRQA